MRASWTDYFRFKTLWLDDITITLLPAAPGRDRQGVRAFENLYLKMVGLGTAVPSHGGLSLKPAAPKTAAGIAAIKAGQARRWAAYRADKLAGRPLPRLGRPKLPAKPPPKPPEAKSVATGPKVTLMSLTYFSDKTGESCPLISAAISAVIRCRRSMAFQGRPPWHPQHDVRGRCSLKATRPEACSSPWRSVRSASKDDAASAARGNRPSGKRWTLSVRPSPTDNDGALS